MRREYVLRSSFPNKEVLQSIVGPACPVTNSHVEEAPDGSGLETRFTIDGAGMDEWLEEKVQRLLRERPRTEGWTVERTRGFVDLGFPPTAPEGTFLFYEHCEIEGPERYGAIGHFFDGYRFYVGCNDMTLDVPGFLDIEDSLEVCVERVTHYIETGEGETTTLWERNPHLERPLRGSRAG